MKWGRVAPPVKVDVPVEDVDSDVAQGEDYPGLGNVWFLKPQRTKVYPAIASSELCKLV